MAIISFNPFWHTHKEGWPENFNSMCFNYLQRSSLCCADNCDYNQCNKGHCWSTSARFLLALFSRWKGGSVTGSCICLDLSSIYFSSMLWQLSNYCFQLVQLYDIVTGNVICHGEENLINDGHKSFPSGHTSCKLFLILASFAAFSQVHDFFLWRRNARYVLTIIFDNF